MSANPIIPIRIVSGAAISDLVAPSVLASLAGRVKKVAYRAPDIADDSRWLTHTIGNNPYRIAQPITFTPYASATPCSARCRFCSETLIEKAVATPSSALRPQQDYFDGLQEALTQLVGLPMSYSLSGLEATDSPDWLHNALDTLQEHGRRSPVQQRVLYTNAAGLANARHGASMIRALANFGTDWIELSRHHFDENANQEIMRFRAGIEVRAQQSFESALHQIQVHIPVKLVCIVQRGGVDSTEGVFAYLDWAIRHGVGSVIFREFSAVDDSYSDNVTARYMASTRVPIAALLEEFIISGRGASEFKFDRITEGYYFWNLIGRYRGIEVIFEASDYTRMHQQHDSGRVYKLVYHANGNLCADWNPQRHILYRSGVQWTNDG